MTEQVKKSTKEKMEKSLSNLAVELKKVRTGRAQVASLDPIKVNYYGNLTPLNQVAALSCPDARSFLIAPWEPSMLKEIESALVKSDLGMSPQNDGKVIRLRLPELTEERRKDIVKGLKKTLEDVRVAIRHARREANEELKKLEKAKQISEDDFKRIETEIQKLTDEYIAKVDKVGSEKEKELMTL